MVIDTLALLRLFVMVFIVWAGQRPWNELEGTQSCRLQGKSVPPYVCLSICPSICFSVCPWKLMERTSVRRDMLTYRHMNVQVCRFLLNPTGLRPLRLSPGKLVKGTTWLMGTHQICLYTEFHYMTIDLFCFQWIMIVSIFTATGSRVFLSRKSRILPKEIMNLPVERHSST